MRSFRGVGRNNEHVVLVFAPFEDDHQEPSGTSMTDPFQGAAVSWLDHHSKLKYLLDFPYRNLRMLFSKVNSSVFLAGKYKPHVRILTRAY